MPAHPKPEDWSVLGVAPGCTRDEARAAYLARAVALHPDRHPDAAADVRARLDRAMAALNEAWDRVDDWSGWTEAEAEGGSGRSGAEPRPAPDDPIAGDPPSWFRPAEELEPLPPPPPGFVALQRSPTSYLLRDEIELVGDSHDLLRLAERPGVAYRRLHCRNRPIREEHLAAAVDALTELRSINLDGTDVGDRAVAHLARLPRLADVQLSDTLVTDGALRTLAGVAKLHSLSLSGTAVTDAGLAHLAGHPSLAVLVIRRTGVEGPGLAALAGCPRLRLLGLSQVRREDRRALAERRPDLTFI